jgi:hypothetical protein
VPALILVLLFRMIATIVGKFIGRTRESKPEPLCSECSFAHIQFGACGRRAISCTFGGVVRPMTIDVLYCTDYRPKFQPPRPAMGFVPEIRAAP